MAPLPEAMELLPSTRAQLLGKRRDQPVISVDVLLVPARCSRELRSWLFVETP